MTERDRIGGRVKIVMSFLKDQSKNTPTDQDPPTPSCIKMAASTLSERFDRRYGGFGGPPKFPQPGELTKIYYFDFEK